MNRNRYGVWVCFFCSLLAISANPTYGQSGEKQATDKPAQNLILITLDGLRWQELFGGADIKLMNKDAGSVRDVQSLKKRFYRESATERKMSLMPFFWNTVAKNGQLIGDPEQGSLAKCTNGLYFSYPGYNELLTGKPDPRISSNAKKYNENVTVLEWLNGQPEFKGRVAAFCSWDVFPFIINDKRSRVYVNAGWSPVEIGTPEKVTSLNYFAGQTPKVWPNVRYDVFTCDAALAYLQARKPRVLYIALGETDDWAHDGRYDLYLDAAHRTDAYIANLWRTVQAMPEYRGKTAMLISTDHGRGGGREGWKNHSVLIQGSHQIWFAAIGKGVAALGNRKSMQVKQSQYAATAASLLGLEFDSDGVSSAINLNPTQPSNNSIQSEKK